MGFEPTLHGSYCQHANHSATCEMGTVTKKESSVEKFKAVLKLLNEANRVGDNDVDELQQQ